MKHFYIVYEETREFATVVSVPAHDCHLGGFPRDAVLKRKLAEVHASRSATCRAAKLVAKDIDEMDESSVCK